VLISYNILDSRLAYEGICARGEEAAMAKYQYLPLFNYNNYHNKALVLISLRLL